MNDFILDPPVLAFKNRTTETKTVSIVGGNNQYYALGTRNLPPNFRFAFKGSLTQNFAISYDANAHSIPPSGNILLHLEIGRFHGEEIHTAFLPVIFVNEPPPIRQNSFNCLICKLEFNQGDRIPKMLNCGHTFCAECIMNVEETRLEVFSAMSLRYFMCPLDGTHTQCESASLPTNLALLDLLIAKKSEEREESNGAKDIVVPCIESSNHESDVYCLGCKEAYCTFCFKSVHSCKILSGHASVPVIDKPVVIPTCPLHDNSLAEFICTKEDCTVSDRYCCRTCLETHHTQHSHKPVQQAIHANIQHLNSGVDDLEAAESNVKGQLNCIDLCASSFDQRNPEMIETRKKIEENINRKRDAALNKFEDWTVAKKQKMIADKVEYQKNLVKIRTIRRKLQKTLMRKTDLHRDRSELTVSRETMAALMPKEAHVFPLDQYDFDSEFNSSPRSPIVINSSPSPIPSPRPMSPDVNAEERERDEADDPENDGVEENVDTDEIENVEEENGVDHDDEEAWN